MGYDNVIILTQTVKVENFEKKKVSFKNPKMGYKNVMILTIKIENHIYTSPLPQNEWG
jgi:hypothetical protein